MRITEPEFREALENVANNNIGQIINFGFDQLEHEHIVELIAALRTNSTAHILDLSADSLPLESYIIISNYIANNFVIERLELGNKEAGDEAITHILTAMLANRSINILDIKANQLTDSIIPLVKTLLLTNPHIKLINLSFNNFSTEGLRVLKNISNPNCLIQYTAKHNLKDDRILMTRKIIKAADKIKRILKSEVDFRVLDQDTINNKIDSIWQIFNIINPSTLNIAHIIAIVHNLILSLEINENIYKIDDFIIYCITNEDLLCSLIDNLPGIINTEFRNQILNIMVPFIYAESSIDDLPKTILAYWCLAKLSVHDEYTRTLQYQIMRELTQKEGWASFERADKADVWHADNGLPAAMFTENFDLDHAQTALYAYKQKVNLCAELKNICCKPNGHKLIY